MNAEQEKRLNKTIEQNQRETTALLKEIKQMLNSKTRVIRQYE